MKIIVLIIFSLIIFKRDCFGQTENFFPGKFLYWTNLQTPKLLDSLKSLKLLTYKNKGVVHNKTFYRDTNENGTLKQYKTTLDFYEYKIRWKRKGRKQITTKQAGPFYFYYGFAAAIYIDRYFLNNVNLQ